MTRASGCSPNSVTPFVPFYSALDVSATSLSLMVSTGLLPTRPRQTVLPTVYLIRPVSSTETENLMDATRAYEANVAAIAAVKGMAMTALEIGRAEMKLRQPSC